MAIFSARQTRMIFTILALFTLFSLFATPLLGQQPPQVKTPIDKKLFQGKPADIALYVKQRREQIKKIITAIDRTIQSEKISKEIRSNAVAVKDLYLGLSLQYKILLSELSRTETTIPTPPKISGPPYKVEDFDKVIAYQREINSMLAAANKRFIFQRSRMSALHDSAVAQLSNYTTLLNTSPDHKLQLLEGYCKLLNIQNEYALLSIRQPRLKNLIKKLVRKQAATTKWINEVFTSLEITDDDVKKAETEKEKQEKLYKKLTEKSSSEYQDMSRQTLVYEARLDKILERIKKAESEQKEPDEKWLLDKSRLELIINALQIRISLINHRRTNYNIKRLRSIFRYQWLVNYRNRTQSKQLSSFLKHWEGELLKLEQKLDETTTSISDSSLARANLTQKLVVIRNRLANAETPQIKQAILALTRQAEKTISNLDQLILLLSDNDHDLHNIQREIEQILDLTRYAVSRKVRFRVWSEVRFADIKNRTLQVLYYPLFSIGTSVINLFIILKIIIFSLIVIFGLRFLRRKIDTLLGKKFGISPGAINSITTLGYYFSLVICSLIILSAVGLDLSQLSIVLGALGVGIGFGLQTITNNFISGIILLSEQSVKVGDYITLNDGVVGEVRKMTIRSTVIRTAEGEDIIVPNSDLISSRVNTWSYDDDWRRLNIPFGVTYDADPEEVARLAEEAAREVSITREDFRHPLRIFFEGFGDNSLNFSIRVWCRMTNLKAPSGLMSDYYFALFRKLREAGINIPYPQRDLHLASISPELKAELRELLKKDGDTNDSAPTNVN